MFQWPQKLQYNADGAKENYLEKLLYVDPVIIIILPHNSLHGIPEVFGCLHTRGRVIQSYLLHKNV